MFIPWHSLISPNLITLLAGVYRERVQNTTAMEANIQHLKPGTQYDFRLVAYNRAGPSPEAASITIHTPQEGWSPCNALDPQGL